MIVRGKSDLLPFELLKWSHKYKLLFTKSSMLPDQVELLCELTLPQIHTCE